MNSRTSRDRAAILEDEELIIRFGGEIPEIAFHSSLHYLCHDPAGPMLTLDSRELLPLQEAVVARYQEIILRDLDPDNRDRRIYRGLARVIHNWRRLRMFLDRQSMVMDPCFQEKIKGWCVRFVEQELADVTAGLRDPCINCSAWEWAAFVRDSLEMELEKFPPGWQDLCRG